MRNYNYIICEDDNDFLNSIREIVEKFNFREDISANIHCFNEYNEKFTDLIYNKLPNKIYILDIETPKKSGKDIARVIREFDNESIIMFISSHTDMAGSVSMDLLSVLTFISKLDNYEEHLEKALLKTKSIIGDTRLFAFKSKQTYYFLNYDEITYIVYDSELRESTIYTDNNKYITTMSLKKCYNKLNKDFIYSHRGCIINTKKLKSSNKNGIDFDNGLHTDLISEMFYENLGILNK